MRGEEFGVFVGEVFEEELGGAVVGGTVEDEDFGNFVVGDVG